MSKHFLNIHWLKNTYYNLTQSLIEYGIVVWGNAAQTHINCLQIAQNTSLKIIYHKPRLHSSKNLYSEAKLLTVKQLYYKKTLYYMSKKNLIQPVVHTYNTRTEKLIYPKMNTTKYYNSYMITGLKLYEKIPISIKKLSKL
ncbi:RNA-directed DNA polymerase from mobile element jockey [Aphis craccivora]|uniref:RNA-directed DNA polymerase from mobile element jockey n=1 Tax=Aphis craccivora TaxID=307492 RepID=A0A6G0Z3H4_APHCR|nr:RNA-directed DNA polymerase from mobile element jockey [Aphis craccivora]